MDGLLLINALYALAVTYDLDVLRDYCIFILVHHIDECTLAREM